MGFKYIKLVMDHSKTKGQDHAIMLALAYRADDQGNCWPSFSTIAKESGLTRRTIYRRMPHLVKMGELSMKPRRKFNNTPGGRQSSHLYTIKLTGRDTQSPPSEVGGWVGTDSPQGEGQGVPRVGTDSPQGRDTLSPESSLNLHRTINRIKNPPGVVFVDPKTQKEIDSLEAQIKSAKELSASGDPEAAIRLPRLEASLKEKIVIEQRMDELDRRFRGKA